MRRAPIILLALLVGCRSPSTTDQATPEKAPEASGEAAREAPSDRPHSDEAPRQFIIKIDREKTAALGLSVSDVSSQVRKALEENHPETPADVASVTITTGDGREVPLSAVATVSLEERDPEESP